MFTLKKEKRLKCSYIDSQPQIWTCYNKRIKIYVHGLNIHHKKNLQKNVKQNIAGIICIIVGNLGFHDKENALKRKFDILKHHPTQKFASGTYGQNQTRKRNTIHLLISEYDF